MKNMYEITTEKPAEGLVKGYCGGVGTRYFRTVETTEELESIGKTLIEKGYDPEVWGHKINPKTGKEYSFFSKPRELEDEKLKAVDKSLYFFRKEWREKNKR
ncbi:MAG: hypothetical protein SVE93_03500 [Candidatus Thermoplasmatota archaeon]|nr:hypothetical protein [Candidatus Thermoplasmatota archaeon]